MGTKKIAEFPDTIRHDSGAVLTIARSKLLLGFKATCHPPRIRAILQPLGWMQECLSGGSKGSHLGCRRLNHTQYHCWVSSCKGQGVSRKDANAACRPYKEELSWIGPVYKFPDAPADSGYVCILPNVLLVKPKSRGKHEQLDRTLRKFNLRFSPAISFYLGNYRLYLLERPRKPQSDGESVFEIHEKLKDEKYADLIKGISFDYMPLHAPTAGLLNDPYYEDASQWNLKEIGAESGWTALGQVNFTPGQGVVVAVIDSGVQLNHPDLVGAFVSGATFKPGPELDTRTGIGPVEVYEGPGAGEASEGYDDPHGTLCAGIIAARCNNGKGIAGLAEDCRIMPLKLQDAPYRSTVAAAITYAAMNGANVISISLGGDIGKGDYLNGPEVSEAIEYACREKNVVICAATMNTDENRIYYPAAHESVIACGATNRQGYRCQGDWPRTVGAGSNYGWRLSVVAPGVDIPTTMIGGTHDGFEKYTAEFGGTSAATPQVAGLAALLMSRYPQQLRNDPVLVRAIIEDSATKVHQAGGSGGTYTYHEKKRDDGSPFTWNEEVGCGLINVENAFVKADDRLQGSGP